MTVFVSAGGRTCHIWRECLPVRSHYRITQRELRSLDMQTVCKRCRARLAREGWPPEQ